MGDHPYVIEYKTLDPTIKPTHAIRTLEGWMNVNPGDYIVGPGVENEYWPVKPRIFEKTYTKYVEPEDPEDPEEAVPVMTANVEPIKNAWSSWEDNK
jgi:hypothetical protein